MDKAHYSEDFNEMSVYCCDIDTFINEAKLYIKEGESNGI